MTTMKSYTISQTNMEAPYWPLEQMESSLLQESSQKPGFLNGAQIEMEFGNPQYGGHGKTGNGLIFPRGIKAILRGNPIWRVFWVSLFSGNPLLKLALRGTKRKPVICRGGLKNRHTNGSKRHPKDEAFAFGPNHPPKKINK